MAFLFGLDSVLLGFNGLFLLDLNAKSSAKESKAYIAQLRAMYALDSSKWVPPTIDSGIPHQEIGALPKSPPFPESNPYSLEKAKLGEKLFKDPKLSASNQIACASCHDRELGFGDGRRVSYGHNRQLGKRNAPSIIMSAFGEEKFWDGRAQNLEAQALMPILDPREMAYHPSKAAKKLNKDKQYRFMQGDSKALSDKEVWGLHLFRTKARCMNCHYGVAFTDQQYHNLGLTYYGRKFEDLGRYNVTKNPDDVGRFKTPSLRQVNKTAPYMHNGLFPHLKGVLNAYNAGMFHPEPKPSQKYDPLFPKTDILLHKLDLSDDELEALEMFLKTL